MSGHDESTAKSQAKRFKAEEIEKPIVPERNLLAAILTRAIQDYVNDRDTPRHIRRDAFRWIRSDDKEPRSYFWVCSGLDLDPLILRKKIFELKKKGVDFCLERYRVFT